MAQTIEELRRKIESATDLQSVVKTMKVLSAVSIRQFDAAARSLAEYSRTVELGLQVGLRGRAEELRLVEQVPADRLGVVVFGSDQGMCGQFNEQIAAFATETMRSMGLPASAWTVLAVGARVMGRLEAEGYAIADRVTVPASVAGMVPAVQAVLLRVEAWHTVQGVDRIYLYHNRPTSAATSRPVTMQLLPVDPAWLRGLATRPWETHAIPAHRLEWRALLTSLIRQHLFVSLYRAFAESLAGEYGARLASMQAAERNIEDYLNDLNAEYRTQRQTAITEELLDIVSGFEALTGKR